MALDGLTGFGLFLLHQVFHKLSNGLHHGQLPLNDVSADTEQRPSFGRFATLRLTATLDPRILQTQQAKPSGSSFTPSRYIETKLHPIPL